MHRKYEMFQKESLSLGQLQDRKLKQTQTVVKQRKQNFLKEYMKDKCNALACSNLEISESTFKRWLKNDNQFKTEYEKISLTSSTSDN